MPKRIKVPLPDGREVEAVEVGFDVKREEWNVYELADGGQVRVKTSVAKIFRVLDSNGKGALTPDGDPEVLVRHSTEIVASG